MSGAKVWPIKYVRLVDMHDTSIMRDKVPMISVGALNHVRSELGQLQAKYEKALGLLKDIHNSGYYMSDYEKTEKLLKELGES
jgi:hypothetical protein